MMDRRSFVRGLSLSALGAKVAAGMTPDDEATDGTAAPVRLGIIGPGSRGKELVRCFLRVRGAKIVAASDVYAPRYKELNALCGYEVPTCADYRALVERKDLDAVIVASPLGFHSEHVLAALQNGHHVYGEKTMAFTVAESQAMVKAVEGGKQIFQVGHQYRYAPWIRKGVERVKQGEIGDVTHIVGYWHRNSDWRRPVPQAGSWQGNAMYPSLEKLINWRLYNQYSLGLLAELGSHHIDVANWVFGETPNAALATGSVAEYHDGRENDDNVQAVLSYSKGRRFIFSSMTNNAMMGDQLWVYGTKGSMNLTLQDAVFFYEPTKAAQVSTNALVTEKGITTGASYRAGGEMPYRGLGKKLEVPVAEDPTQTACRAFVDCVRTGKKPLADVHAGCGSALAVVVANEAIKAKRELPIPSA
jgi:predicted dehydrogenase